jgi:tRNA(Ile)-lysidine synthase
VDNLLAQITQKIRRRKLFKPGDAIVVSVSGGLDSMVLLEALNKLTPEFHWKLSVAHLNHQLRGRSSDADERLVRKTAKKAGFAIDVERVDVLKFAAKHKLSIEMAGRKLRHDFLARCAVKRGTGFIALGHHADDQLELFFLRLLRGSGGEGLAGMKFLSPSPADSKLRLVRPLLEFPKALLGQYAKENRIPFREDASNATLEIQRNRIRHELLPLLRMKYQTALERTINRAMEIIGSESELVSELARGWLAARNTSADEAIIPFAHSSFSVLPPALQRRCLQLQLLDLGIAPEFELVERLRLAPQCLVTLGPAHADQSVHRDLSGRLRLSPVGKSSSGFNVEEKTIRLTNPGGTVIFSRIKVAWRLQTAKAAVSFRRIADREVFDADRVGPHIVLRHWRPGDRFQPIGMANAAKLQDLFTNAKVPRDLRRNLVVATTAENQIFWVEGLRISEQFKVRSGTIRSLLWRWQRV